MKKLALVNSYCNTEEKINTLKNNLIALKNLGIDSLLYSPIALPEDVVQYADYTFITKENPIIEWPERGIIYWSYIDNTKCLIITPDYGWASLYQFKKLSEIANTFDYDFYFWFLYDTKIDEVVIETLKIPNKKLFFNSAKTSQGVKCGNVFASFNKENLIKFSNLLEKDDYILSSNGKINEYYTELKANIINANISSHVVYDTIDELSNITFNFAPENLPFKLFFTNNEEFIFYLYDVKDLSSEFKLYLNNELVEFNFLKGPIKININCDDIKSLYFTYDNEIYNLYNYLKNKTIQKIEI